MRLRGRGGFSRARWVRKKGGVLGSAARKVLKKRNWSVVKRRGQDNWGEGR